MLLTAFCRMAILRSHYQSWRSCRGLTKTLRIMKLTGILLLGFAMTVTAHSVSQTVSFTGKNVPLEEVLESVKKQTGFTIISNLEQIRQAKPLNLRLKDLAIQDFLSEVFKDLPFEFVIKQQTVFIKQKEEIKPIHPIFNNPLLYVSMPPIKGRVLAEDGTPLSGASIIVRGKKISTSTDADGFFSINAEEGETLIVSFVGFSNRLLKATSSIGSVTLEKSQSKLDEVQIIGYGTTTQRFNVGSVTKVSSEEISRQPVGNPLAALQGRAPGLLVTQANGLPGGSVTMRIRGQNSLNPKSNGDVLFDNPLYIINGVPFAPQNNKINQYSSIFGSPAASSAVSPGYSPFNSISPSDIESIEILRDADATAIYGSRGANGVVLITTKKGQKGKATVNANIYYGQSHATKAPKMMNTEQYLAMRKEAFANENITPNLTIGSPGFAPDLLAFDQTKNTDWVNTFIGGNANVTDANVSISGGSENTQFLIGTTIRSETFILVGDSKNDRLTFNANLHHHSPNKKLSIDFNANYSVDKNFTSQNGNVAQGFILPPNYPELYDSSGNLVWSHQGINLNNLRSNPFSLLLQTYRVRNYNLVSNTIIGYQLFRGLEFKTSLGYNDFDGGEEARFPRASQNPISTTFGNVKFGSNKFTSWIIEPQFDFNRIIFNGRLSITIGSSFQKTINNSTDIVGQRYTNDATLGTITAAGTVSVKDSYSEYKYNAIFGRVNYTLQNKYILNLTGRRDGSSRFGPNRQFGNFGSVGAGWIFSQEAFVQEVIPFLSFGKIKASFGTTGNDNIGNYQYINPYTAVTGINYQGNVGVQTTNLFNPDYSWSVKRDFQVGLEFGLSSDKILGNVTYFNNKSGNQLVQYTLPIQTGFGTVLTNAPYEVGNSGLELSLSTSNIKTKNFAWNSSITLTIPKNRLISFPGIEQSPYNNTYVVGKSLSVLRKFLYKGINKTSGIFEFQDLNKDGIVLPFDDYTAIGDLDEDLYGGINNDFSYKGFRVNVFVYFSKGMGENMLRQIYSAQPTGFPQNLPVAFLDRWQNDGSTSRLQRLTTRFSSSAYAAGTNFSESDAVYSDASYIRLKNVSLSYDLPDNVLQKLKLQSLRLFVNAQNLLTISSYEGLDPEGKSYYSIPLLRTIAAGINFNF